MAIEIATPFAQALELLERTEKELLVLVAQAAEEGDYEGIAKITNYAREINKLVRGVASSPREQKVETPLGASPEGYPKFFRDGNKLVMVGWSKKRNAEYVHVAPQLVLELLIQKLTEACKSKETVTAGELLPLFNPETGEEFPEYYVRTFLRWLRSIGAVKKYGHRGYAIRTGFDYQGHIQSSWNRLVARH